MPVVEPTRVFTREDPCTKVHIWNCFIGPKGLATSVPVVTSRSKIGLNTPKYLLREGYIDRFTEAGVEYYIVTPSGEEWLRKGLKRHLELHPDERAEVVQIAQLEGSPKPARVVRATRRAAT
jgi:hypothetical protein